MATNIQAIQPRRVDFRTQTNADWLDGLVVWRSASAGVVAGETNAGTGSLVVAGVAPDTLHGVHVLTVTATDGLTRYTVEDPNGLVTGQGAAEAPIFAGGLTLTLSAGATPYAVGDAFAVSVLPAPIDLTGIGFDLHVRATPTTANVALSASSAPADGSTPTLVVGTSGGQVALRVLRDALTASRFPPGLYVYDILASADGLRVPAFFGTLEHVHGATYLP